MSEELQQKVRDQLAKVKGPDLNGNLIELGLIENILVSEGKAIFSIKVPAHRAKELEPLRTAAERAVMEVDEISSVTAVLTAERQAGSNPQRSSKSPAGSAGPAGVPGIGSIIAVASGKGGVGKSTTSVNLALGIAAQGLKVGILDADIYGPSMPRMLGVREKPTGQGKALIPIEAHGLKVMSMGFLVDEEAPMIWRGPMVISALTQMLREVLWGELDILVIDMPPGTGDAQLTMAQQVPLAGAVIVSTPQDIALIDARKGLNMFRKVAVPILGLIENMSTFVCPKCGERSDIFGHGGARQEAEKLNMPFLGEVPLHMDIRTNSDAGTPVTICDADGPHARIYRDIATGVLEQMAQNSTSQTQIIFE